MYMNDWNGGSIKLKPSFAAHVTQQQHQCHTAGVAHSHQLTLKPTHTPQSLRHLPMSIKKWDSLLQPIVPEMLPGASRKRLGRRWTEYQGAGDWAGLLNPLDDRLRGEILRYGDFNEAAYRAFEFDPDSTSYGSCKFPKRTLLEDAGFLETGYRVTRNLIATSGIQLPGWASPARSSWAAMQSSWIGYVAVCKNKAEIARLGRRDIVIALRGTATCLEWLENFRATLAPIPGTELQNNTYSAPMVETGFLSLYSSGEPGSLRDAIREEVARILEKYPNEELSITLTGHSLGAALATLAAYDIKCTFVNAPPVTVMSFGGPRVGNRSFRSLLEKQGIKILRIVNPNDLITKVPGIVIDNNEDDNEDDDRNSTFLGQNNMNKSTSMSKFGFGFRSWFWPSWIQKRVEDTQTQWTYAEVGCELRLENKDQPKYEMNLAKCHDLKTYLKLVKGLSSKCPIRASANKILRKRKTPVPA